MRGRRILTFLGGAVFMLGCTSNDPVVGVLQPLTGSAHSYGQSLDCGMQVALAEAEQSARLPEGFRLHRVNTASDPGRAVAEYRRLVREQGAHLVVGGTITEEALALIPEVEEERVICLSPSVSANEISRRSRYFYRMYPTDEAEGRTAARFLYDDRSARTVLIFSDSSMYTRGVELEFRQHFQLNLLGKIVATVHLKDPLWRRKATDLLHAHDPDAVYIIGYACRILEVLRHLEETGYDGIRSTTSTFFVGDVLSEAGKAADGVVFPLSAYDARSLQEPTQGFVDAFKRRYGADPDIFAAHGYDAMRVAIHAVTSADRLATNEIRKVMSFQLDGMMGVTGAISFDDHGDVRRYPIMYSVYEGEVIPWSRVVRLRLEAAERALSQMTPASATDDSLSDDIAGSRLRSGDGSVGSRIEV